MGKVTKKDIAIAYDIAKRVYEGTLSAMEGKKELCQIIEMAEGTAIGYVGALKCMLNGEKYTRTINLYATEYYLEHIGQDFGKEKQKIAAQAVKKHVKYYESVNGYLRGTDELSSKYL